MCLFATFTLAGSCNNTTLSYTVPVVSGMYTVQQKEILFRCCNLILLSTFQLRCCLSSVPVIRMKYCKLTIVEMLHYHDHVAGWVT
jgi:hypothetical protein